MKKLPQRKSPRLQGYDYSQSGAYFVTICTHRKDYLFGDVVNDEMQKFRLGDIAEQRWYDLPNHFEQVVLDGFVVMPNHVHGIIFIMDASADSVNTDTIDRVPTEAREHVGTASMPSARPKLGTIIGTYKAAVTRYANRILDDPPSKIWQSRYHDHIIRNEADLKRIREYVLYNPQKWESDTFYG
ncbi:MAG: hypothetical protein AAFQ07_03230 [Chloroflexota bacterium]